MNKNQIFILSMSIMLILGSSCGKNKKTNKSIDDFNNLQPASKPTTFDPGKSNFVLPTNNFANDFCDLIKEGGNPFILEKYFLNEEDLEYVQEGFDLLRKEEYT